MPVLLLRLGFITAATVLLAACATPASDTSVIPNQTGELTAQKGVFTQPIHIKSTQPGCKGQCAQLQVNSLVFPGRPELSQFVDQQLTTLLLGLNEGHLAAASDLDQAVQQYWDQAGPHDQLILSAKVAYANKDLTVLELGVWQYLTGAAHGMSSLELVNWDNAQNKVLALKDLLQANQLEAFEQRLAQAHQAWLKTQDPALEDPVQYQQLWPFQPTTNVGLNDAGLIAQYNSYDIAPYSSGQPRLLVPYTQLQGILKPRYLPR